MPATKPTIRFKARLLRPAEPANATWTFLVLPKAASNKLPTRSKDITAVARRDWIHWITSGKKAETRVRRIDVACDKLANGQRRACCFDRSGMYSNSLAPPQAAD